MGYRLGKAAILGVLIGLTGLGFGLLSIGLDLDESVGLSLLFKLRGVRQPPPDVAVVSIDKASADHLKLPYDTRKWPRTLHARLIDELVTAGASVIVFDMAFDIGRAAGEDRALADAVSRAGNVVLCERLRRDTVSLEGDGGRAGTRGISIVKCVPPVSPIGEAAAALAPFPLPKVPVRVNQFWTFTTGAGETPTLPVAALQIHARPVSAEFSRFLAKSGTFPPGTMPLSAGPPPAAGSVAAPIPEIRRIFADDPSASGRMLTAMTAGKELAIEPEKRRLLAALIGMYRAPDSLHLNFYGPPGTIPTVPYYRVLQRDNGQVSAAPHPNLRNRAVFVGLSELLEFEQKDDFYTVFSQKDGRDISGVEIAATAFANLLEDRPVRPLEPAALIAILFLWGMASGMSCRLLSAPLAFGSAVLSGVLYLLFAQYRFATAGTWYPVFTPLFVQTPLALFGAFLWKFVDANRERQNIRKAFGYYLPEEMVDRLARNFSELSTQSRLVHGICLCTDVERYTSLAETMAPEELGRHMNDYFGVLFGPVKENGGFVSDLKGDSILALWVSVQPDAALREKACRAALEIDRAVLRFNRAHKGRELRTRIGVHNGEILLGNVGAMDHFEYRPLGDMVNTVSRIENLNKHLGTRLLVSGDVLAELDGFFTRELGTFMPAGKTRPLVIHELICPLTEAGAPLRAQRDLFREALRQFRQQSWDKAASVFTGVIELSGDDGPSQYYLTLCERYSREPPGESWDGVIRMESK